MVVQPTGDARYADANHHRRDEQARHPSILPDAPCQVQAVGNRHSENDLHSQATEVAETTGAYDRFRTKPRQYPKNTEEEHYGSTWGICTRRAGKLERARSRLYRSKILRENMRWN